MLDAEEHLAFHEEVRELKEQDVARRCGAPRSAGARVQTGAAGAVGFERQIPALKCQRAARIEAQQLQTG